MADLSDDLRAEIRRLRRINAASFAILAVVVLGAFAQAATSRATKFDEIDVGRINVRDPDGTLRLTISNQARLPQVVVEGKQYPLRGGTGAGSAGFIFFNDEGNENGGLIWQGKRDPGGYHASESLTFDQFNQDETVALSYGDVNGRRSAGLQISDRANQSIRAFAESAMVIRGITDAQERARRMQSLRANAAAIGGASIARAYIGKQPDKSAVVTLGDPKGRTRLRMIVDSLGTARIEFLDESGRVTSQLPSKP